MIRDPLRRSLLLCFANLSKSQTFPYEIHCFKILATYEDFR
jgi:hypothetical protein